MMETANRRTLAVWIMVLILIMITGCWPADRSHRDTQAPTVPDYVTAQAVSPTQVNLTWWAARDNVAVTGYYIYSSGRQIGSTASTRYDLSGLAPDTAYRFSVAAYDQAGNVSPTSAPVSVRTPIAEDDYVAYWPFDEGTGATTANLGLKTYSTTLQNGASWTDGISGKALQLDGIDDYATITDRNAIPFDIGHLTQGTISVWFKVDTLPGADEIHPILYMGDGVGGSGHSCIIIELGHFSGGTQLYFTVLDDNKRISMCFNSRQNLETGTWHHFAGVVGPDYNTGYLNGVELTDRNYNGGTSATRQFFADVADKRVFWFGRGLLSSIQTGQYLDGAIDEIKIYNRPLTEVEIQNYYHYMTLETSPPEIEPGDDAQAGSDVCGIYLLSSRAMTGGRLTLVGDRDEDFVTGFAARIGWEDIEPEAGVFDFSVLTDLLPRLEANGQRLTLQILGSEPAHVVADAQSTWTWFDPNPRHTGDCADEDGCLRPLPWDPGVFARQRELFSALADTQISYNGGSVALAQHPLLDQVMMPLVGWGRIRELGFQVEDWPGYTRDKLVQATTDNILMHYEYFPSIPHQIQLFTVRDTDNSKELWEALLEEIVAKTQAEGLPMPTLLVENLAHRIDETGDNVFGPNPTGQGRGLIAGKALGTWTGLQMLAPWSKPFPGTENSLAGGNPVDAMLWADETYGARYFELYSADVDAALAGNHTWLEGLQVLGNSLCAPQ